MFSRTLHLDYETFSPVDLIRCGVYRYAEEAEIIMVQYAFDDQPVTVVDLLQGEPFPQVVLDALRDPAILKIAQNANFERTITKACLGIECPPEQWKCTSVWAASLGLPASLGQLTEVLGLGDKGKLASGKALIKKFCVPCKPTKKNGQRVRNLPHHIPEDWEAFKRYGHNDVEAEREVERRFKPYPMPDSEWALWCLDQRINDRGILIDIKLVGIAIASAEEVRLSLMARAGEITQLANPNSRAQLISWLDSEDVITSTLTKKDVEQLLGSTDNERVIELLEIRQMLAKASVSKYKALARAVCKDGRLRGSMAFNGAGRTARWAGRIFQPQNLPSKGLIKDIPLARELLLNDRELLPVIYNSVPQALSSLIRPALIARPGHTYVVIDFSAIEARMLAWLAKEQWRLDLFAAGLPLYETSAEKMFDLPPGSVGKKDPNRQKGKVAELALGYQGWEGALITMGALDMGLQLEELAPIAAAWRLANPAIEQYWYDCEKAVLKAVAQKTRVQCGEVAYSCDGKFLFCHLPSGRKMAYVRPKIGTNTRGKQAVSFEGIEGSTKAWGRRWLYGGLLVENQCQAIARDCLALALIETEKVWPEIMFHVHDEEIVEVPEDRGEEALHDLEEILGRPIPWAPGLLLKGDGYLTPFYVKDSD